MLMTKQLYNYDTKLSSFMMWYIFVSYDSKYYRDTQLYNIYILTKQNVE